MAKNKTVKEMADKKKVNAIKKSNRNISEIKSSKDHPVYHAQSDEPTKGLCGIDNKKNVALIVSIEEFQRIRNRALGERSTCDKCRKITDNQ